MMGKLFANISTGKDRKGEQPSIDYLKFFRDKVQYSEQEK